MIKKMGRVVAREAGKEKIAPSPIVRKVITESIVISRVNAKVKTRLCEYYEFS